MNGHSHLFLLSSSSLCSAKEERGKKREKDRNWKCADHFPLFLFKQGLRESKKKSATRQGIIKIYCLLTCHHPHTHDTTIWWTVTLNFHMKRSIQSTMNHRHKWLQLTNHYFTYWNPFLTPCELSVTKKCTGEKYYVPLLTTICHSRAYYDVAAPLILPLSSSYAVGWRVTQIHYEWEGDELHIGLKNEKQNFNNTIQWSILNLKLRRKKSRKDGVLLYGKM